MRAFRCAALALAGPWVPSRHWPPAMWSMARMTRCCTVRRSHPVDLSLPLHQTLPKVAPGGKLVFSLDNHGCECRSQPPDPQMAFQRQVQPPSPKPAPTREA